MSGIKYQKRYTRMSEIMRAEERGYNREFHNNELRIQQYRMLYSVSYQFLSPFHHHHRYQHHHNHHHHLHQTIPATNSKKARKAEIFSMYKNNMILPEITAKMYKSEFFWAHGLSSLCHTEYVLYCHFSLCIYCILRTYDYVI